VGAVTLPRCKNRGERTMKNSLREEETDRYFFLKKESKAVLFTKKPTVT